VKEQDDLPSLSVAIPTLGREEVLLNTVEALLALEQAADEILVIDQTPTHAEETARALKGWHDGGRIRWLRLTRASIPFAMNVGLREAASEVVLFLDDDIVPEAGLVAAHRRTQRRLEIAGVTGMVLQPGEAPTKGGPHADRGHGLRRDLGFRFSTSEPCDVANVMAGNLSVKRAAALACGGFDESFVGVAYRFETEFCRRLQRNGGRVVFEPAAVIRHLRAPSGGTRVWGDHKTSARPEHSVGDYYFALLEGRGRERWVYSGQRMVRECCTRFHLAHPWFIPSKIVGELRGFALATRLARERRSSG
jgi:GT2 family glycosyltransferase